MQNVTKAGLSLALLTAPFLTATAEVPVGPPVFGTSLDFDNDYFPFEVGAYKILAGQDETGTPIFSVELYIGLTREFQWNGASIDCRIQQEIEFEDGELIEISTNYFGQADDGSVYYFGELVDNYEDGAIVDNEGTWLVGGATAPGDPASTANAAAPALFMPAKPEVGDTWKPEDTPPFVEEFAEVFSADAVANTPYGAFDEALLVRESSSAGSPDYGVKFYAPGLGTVIDGSRNGASIRLIGTNL